MFDSWPQDRILQGQDGKKLVPGIGDIIVTEPVIHHHGNDEPPSVLWTNESRHEFFESSVNPAFMQVPANESWSHFSNLGEMNQLHTDYDNINEFSDVTSVHRDNAPSVPAVENSPRFFSPWERIRDVSHIGGIPSQLKKEAWGYELTFSDNHEQREFLGKGIREGFNIVDDVPIPTYECRNYLSSEKNRANIYISNLFKDEITKGLLVPTTTRPHCVHAIGAVEKKDGSYRPITDCRRPLNYSINNFMSQTSHPFKYNSLDMVCDRLSRGDFMACTDIKAAYRSVAISPRHWQYQGIYWGNRDASSYYYDTRLSFGLKCAPYIFNSISDFVVESMSRRGYSNIINYLNNYFCWGPTFQDCAETQNVLIRLFGQLGFIVAWSKCSSPSTSCVFLGIEINSIQMEMSLPDTKLQKLTSELKFFYNRDRATVKQLRRLCGILSYASHVVRGRRTFSRRVIDLLKDLPPDAKRVRLTSQFRRDIAWWCTWAVTFNGTATMIPHNFGEGPSMYSDASLKGYGITSSESWHAGYFNSTETPNAIASTALSHLHWINLQVGADHSINFLELVPLWLACVMWGHRWRNSQVVCWSDNTQVVASIN